MHAAGVVVLFVAWLVSMRLAFMWQRTDVVALSFGLYVLALVLWTTWMGAWP